MKLFKELYQYRELLKTNVKKDIRGKYKASFLGVLWSFINPLLQVLVYAIVFPYIMKIQTPNYLIFLICGIILGLGLQQFNYLKEQPVLRIMLI
jgi:lipopolysaccharide transport system permease protein